MPKIPTKKILKYNYTKTRKPKVTIFLERTEDDYVDFLVSAGPGHAERAEGGLFWGEQEPSVPGFVL